MDVFLHAVPEVQPMRLARQLLVLLAQMPPVRVIRGTFQPVVWFWIAACLLMGHESTANGAGLWGLQPPAQIIPAGAPDDEWFRILFDDEPIGYERIRSEHVGFGKPNHQIRRIRETRLVLKRFGSDLSLSATLETTETPDGQLMGWSLRRTGGDGNSIERSGIWVENLSHYSVNEKVQGTRRTRIIQSPAPAWSPAISSWLPKFVTKQTQRRSSVSVLFPETAAIAEIQISVKGRQGVRSKKGKALVAKHIEYWPKDAPDQKNAVYVDDLDQVVLAEQPLMGGRMILERSDAATALGSGNSAGLQVELTGMIPVRNGIPNPETRRVTRMRISVPQGQQLVIPQSLFQTVETDSPNQVNVTLLSPVETGHREGFSRLRPSEEVAEEFLISTPLITSDNEAVHRLTRLSAGTVADPLEGCRRMSRYLFANLKPSPFSTICQPASEVAKTMRGDCTEHAVLLAAMMRASGIPSRVVIGLTYVERTSSLMAHMWAEAWIDGKWIPYDSTKKQGQPGATTLRLADSGLTEDSGDGLLLFLPLLDLIGKAQVDILADSPE
ncbi:MAG: transglutaminase domain-containing protein [Planctomyces sp.]|nr:transglutaminase domain-containing protein [Planctomyces sp.]